MNAGLNITTGAANTGMGESALGNLSSGSTNACFEIKLLEPLVIRVEM